jgi:hypothetical protein
MPTPSFISINVILCETLLLDQENVYSAIRIKDVYYFERQPGVAPEHLPPIPMKILVIGKTPPEDESKHSVQLGLIAPDGRRSFMGDPLEAVLQARLNDESLLAEGSKASDIAGGFTIVARINIVPTQVGLHYVVVFLDGQPVARCPFTILELKPQSDA